MNIVFLRVYSYPTPHYDRLAANLRGRGHTVWVGTLSPDSTFEWHDGSRVFAVQAGPVQSPGWLRRWHLLASVFNRIAHLIFILGVRRFLWATSPDIVQVNPTSMYFVWLLPLFMPGHTRFILHYCELLQRGETSLAGKLRNALDNWVRQISARYLYSRTCFVNAAGARKVLGTGWPQVASIIPHGVAPGFLSLKLPPLAASQGDEPVQFIYLGILSRVRRLETLLAAIQVAQATTGRVRVTFIGSDAAQGFYHSLVEQLGLGSAVTIKPPVPYAEVPGAVSGYDVALQYIPDFPPDWHYYPTLKVQEYRALGLPIIASDFQPNHEFVQEGVNGLLVPNTVEAWAGALTTFAVDRAFLRGCQANARRMRQGKTWSEIARIWEQDVYHAVAAGGPASAMAHHAAANKAGHH